MTNVSFTPHAIYSSRPALPLSRNTRRPHATLAVLAAVFALFMFLAAPLSASAHDRLVSSDPAAGAVLTAAPERISLAFSDNILELGSAIELKDAQGTLWNNDELRVAGPVLSIGTKPDLPSGSYTAVWRAVSADGHPITGEVAFSVKLADAAAAESTPSKAADAATNTTATAIGTAAPQTESSASSAATPTADPAATSASTSAAATAAPSDTAPSDNASTGTPEEKQFGSPVLYAVIGALLVLAIVLIVKTVRRARS